jgi:hypothetical protein
MPPLTHTLTTAVAGLRPLLLAILAAASPHTPCSNHATIATFCSTISRSAEQHQQN